VAKITNPHHFSHSASDKCALKFRNAKCYSKPKQTCKALIKFMVSTTLEIYWNLKSFLEILDI